MGKIMFIDDDPMVLRMASFIAKKGGCQAVTAQSGSEGLELARAQKPDIIFVDAEMPEMDGFEVISRLRADPETADITVYMMSGTVTEEVKEKARSSAAEDIIGKPLNAAEILGIINNQ